MITDNIIANNYSAEGKERLSATDPRTKKTLAGKFAIATKNEIDRAAQAADAAWDIYRYTSGATKARFLNKIADNIEGLGDELIHRAMAESGLPKGRITGERGRTCGQLRLFAKLVEEGSWVRAMIDPAQPDRQPMPRSDIRKMYQSLGPVVIFGASNFPLAFSTAGGDTASALASGSPVMIKGHPSHPGTNSYVSQAIARAAKDCGLPAGVFSSVNGGTAVGKYLVSHPLVKAVGFTGSLGGGNAIMKAAAERPQPIPVYAEMGSINPIFLLSDMLEGDLESLADTLAASINMGAGQFCTNPGIIVVPQSPNRDAFLDALTRAFAALPSFTMLNEGIYKNYTTRKTATQEDSGVTSLYAQSDDGSWSAHPALATTDHATFTSNPNLHHEVFGPFSLVVLCSDDDAMMNVATSLEGQLTATIIGSKDAIAQQAELVKTLAKKAGRIIFNDVPTGVEVGHAMHHGGPYPSASSGMYTSVGTDAILRFVRPVCYQNAPESVLPDALHNDNPLDIWRIVDGETTKA